MTEFQATLSSIFATIGVEPSAGAVLVHRTEQQLIEADDSIAATIVIKGAFDSLTTEVPPSEAYDEAIQRLVAAWLLGKEAEKNMPPRPKFPSALQPGIFEQGLKDVLTRAELAGQEMIDYVDLIFALANMLDQQQFVDKLGQWDEMKCRVEAGLRLKEKEAAPCENLH